MEFSFVNNISAENSSPSILAVLFSVAIGIILGYRTFFQRNNETTKTFPPLAPEGYIETGLAIIGKDSLQFHLRNAIKLGDFYRIRVPIPGPMTVIVSDLKIYRDILKDRSSTKITCNL